MRRLRRWSAMPLGLVAVLALGLAYLCTVLADRVEGVR